MKRAVKYCGGCNPRYDRVAFVRSLEEKFGQTFTGAQIEQEYDEVYIVCGCFTHCADISNIKAKKIIIIDPENVKIE